VIVVSSPFKGSIWFYLLAPVFFLLIKVIGFIEILSILDDGIVVSCMSINQAVPDNYPLCCSVFYPGSMTSV